MNPDISTLLLNAKTEIKNITDSLSEEGAAPNAAALAPKIEALMRALQTLSKDEAKTYVPALETMQNELDELKARFLQHAQTAKAGLDQISTLSRANTAYARHGAMTGKRDE